VFNIPKYGQSSGLGGIGGLGGLGGGIGGSGFGSSGQGSANHEEDDFGGRYKI